MAPSAAITSTTAVASSNRHFPPQGSSTPVLISEVIAGAALVSRKGVVTSFGVGVFDSSAGRDSSSRRSGNRGSSRPPEDLAISNSTCSRMLSIHGKYGASTGEDGSARGRESASAKAKTSDGIEGV